MAAPATPAETSGKAIASLICGLFIFFFPISIVAVVLGHLSLSEIRRSAGRLKGDGLAIAGLVLGYLGIVFMPFLLIIAAIAIPNLLRARIAANEAMAVASVRTLMRAEIAFAQAHPNAGVSCSLSDLTETQLIDGPLATGSKYGYTFELSGCTPGAEQANVKFQIVAYPLTPKTTGIRAFCGDESGLVRVDANGSTQDCLVNGSPLQ
jgi:type IV pilus assembly protein PilA